MDITTSTAVGAAALTGSASQATPVISSDFETFIKMLTAQARYQDPLEPIDSSEYAAQLAQFSMVEQQVLSNELLTSLASQLGAGNMAQLANWIGMEARTTAPVQFDGSPIQITPNPAAVSDQVFLIVRNGSGQEVQRIQIPVSSEPIEWAGVANDGGPFENGRYSFDIESRANGQVILSEPSQTYSRIVETRLEGTQTVLVLEGGSAISTNDVSGLREPSSGL